MQKGWLLRDGQVLAAADLADSFIDRTRGLFAKRSYDAAMLLPHTRSVHSFGLRFPLDVAFLDKEGTVIDITVVPTWRVTMPRMRASQAIEAKAGSFGRWGLKEGDRVEFRATP